jgi:hypothetical protein
LPAEEKHSHFVFLPEGPWVRVACECTWQGPRMSMLALSGNDAAAMLREQMLAHVQSRRALYQPTLADLTDWGWFNAESGAQ